jgi:hypothetical protein
MAIKTIVTGGRHEDPTEWSGTNPLCKTCGEKEIEYQSDHCEDHQRCYYCGEREQCVDDGKNCKELE